MAIITISRGTFSGGQGLAQCVAERLGYRCLARVVAHEAALRYGVSEEKLSKAMEEPPGILERLRTERERARYLACARATLVREVKNDNVVYHGLAEHFLLEGVPHVLRVRVIANIEFRIKGAMERTGLERKEAIEYIKKADEKRVRWARFLYQADWYDPSLYDLVINLDHISLDSACEIVCHCVSLDEFARAPEWQKIMDDLVLSTEVRAIVAANKGIADSGLEVEADGGVITLGGTVGSLQDEDKIREIAAAAPGVKDINSKMQVKPTW
ncbi:cytidylate kinase family protein [Chloroflexota bacterium]